MILAILGLTSQMLTVQLLIGTAFQLAVAPPGPQTTTYTSPLILDFVEEYWASFEIIVDAEVAWTQSDTVVVVPSRLLQHRAAIQLRPLRFLRGSGDGTLLEVLTHQPNLHARQSFNCSMGCCIGTLSQPDLPDPGDRGLFLLRTKPDLHITSLSAFFRPIDASNRVHIVMQGRPIGRPHLHLLVPYESVVSALSSPPSPTLHQER
jgi:hypothetical protein